MPVLPAWKIRPPGSGSGPAEDRSRSLLLSLAQFGVAKLPRRFAEESSLTTLSE
jgi:hypothetical protein